MREIEFRGKRIDNGEWVYGFYSPLIWYPSLEQTPSIKTLKGGDIEINLETLGQYTGHKDKNGTKIFEGDIAKLEVWGVKHDENRQLIKYKVCEEFLLIEYKTMREEDGDGNEIVFDGFCAGEYSVRELVEAKNWKFEIIGNMHDNPELLTHQHEDKGE